MKNTTSTEQSPAKHGGSPRESVEADAPQRCGDLQRLLAAWPNEIADVSVAGRCLTLRRLERALRQERARARAGHWAYDVARHQQLARLLRAEQAALQRCEAGERLQHLTQITGAQKIKARV